MARTEESQMGQARFAWFELRCPHERHGRPTPRTSRSHSLIGPMLTCPGRGSNSSFQDIAEREAGFEAGYAGQPGQFVLMEPAVIVNAGDADDEHVIILTSHEVTGGDALGFAH